MKKLALVLGSLLVVGTAASAKEVVPAPVVVPEKVVEVVEKPVIVYRDREVEQGWKPNGSVDVEYRYYGKTENKDLRDDVSWDRKANQYGRLQTRTILNFTENNNLDIRTRNFQTLRDTDKAYAPADELRLRHHYNFGTIGDSKVTAKSRLEYLQKGNDGGKSVAASVAFDFSNYFFSNDYFKVDTFALRPIYIHKWSGHDNDSTVDVFGLNLETEYTLPLGFTAEFNVKTGNEHHSEKFTVDKGDKRNEMYADVELYLYNTTNLYKNGAYGVDFVFEGGYDPYSFRQYKVDNSRRSYELYAQPALKASYKPTDFVNLYVAAGAEYRNWNISRESQAKDWRWQPMAWAGMKVSF